jgi:hypothetical protein
VHVEGGQRWKIKPSRKFVYRDFPSNQPRTLFRSEWKPIFGKILETPGLVIPTHEREIDDAFVKRSYTSATRFLRENYNYIFEGPEESTESLLISMWSKKVRRKDTAKLAPLNPKNKPRRSYVRLPGVRRKRRKVHRRGYDRQGIVEEAGEHVEVGNGSEGEPDT